MFFAITNQYRSGNKKSLTLILDGNNVDKLGLAADGWQRGHYPDGSDTAPSSGPNELRPITGEIIIKASYDPQPQWETFAFTHAQESPVTITLEKVKVDTHCDVSKVRGRKLEMEKGSFGGPLDSISIRDLEIFPMNVDVDTSVPPTFTGPLGSGTWSYSFVTTDPEGDPRAHGGVRWTTDGTGIAAYEDYATSLTMMGHADTAYSLFAFDDVAGEYMSLDLVYTDFIPTITEWGALAMTLLLLIAGTVVLRQRRSVAP